MKCWISHVRHMEWFADEATLLMDSWVDGGVDGIVLGPPVFGSAETLAHSRGREKYRAADRTRAVFSPQERWYREFGVSTPLAPQEDDTELRAKLHAALAQARDRGIEVWLFDPFTGADAPDLSDNAGRIAGTAARPAMTARMLDTMAAFPEATGFIIDGPAWGFEITDLDVEALRTRRRLLELPSEAGDCARLGYDLDRLREVDAHLQSALTTLTPDRISAAHDALSTGGDAAVALLGNEFREWSGFRCDALTELYQHMHAAMIDHFGTDFALAVCPRTIALGPAAGYDYARIADAVDVMMPKMYFWQRGYDGLVGTAYRWARTLQEWNPALSVADACRATRSVFGDSFPLVEELADFDRVLTPDYVRKLTVTELTRTKEATGDRVRLVPWVDSGRAPHDGDPMPAALLDAILLGLQDIGMDRFTYFSSTNMSEAEWTVVSQTCGQRWAADRTPGWYPPDQPTL